MNLIKDKNILKVYNPSSSTISGNGKVLVVQTCSSFLSCFKKTTEGWVPCGIISLEGGMSTVSLQLSTNGHIIIIGESTYDKVRVFSCSNFKDDRWEQIGNDIKGSKDSKFGHAVTMSFNGNIIAVSAPYKNEHSGTVFIYHLTNNKGWKLHGSGVLEGQCSGDEFGHSITLSRNGYILAISAPYGNNKCGYVIVYKLTEEMIWSRVGDPLSNNIISSQFGQRVIISDDGLTVGIVVPYTRQTEIFTYDTVHTQWYHVGKPIVGYYHSLSMSKNGRMLVLSDIHTDTVSIYVLLGSLDEKGTWFNKGNLVGPLGSHFGLSVSVTNYNSSTLIISNKSHLFIYTLYNIDIAFEMSGFNGTYNDWIIYTQNTDTKHQWNFLFIICIYVFISVCIYIFFVTRS
jgi:hypothetical protein